jgi:hypothetical protein
MYRRAGQEERNAFVIERNRTFRRLNVLACLAIGVLLMLLFAVHLVRGTQPGWATLILVTFMNVAFLLRGEANWRVIVAAARRSAAGQSPPRATPSTPARTSA